MEFRTAAVIGLGLIGGSVARELAGRGVRVLGADRDRDSVDAALRAGVLAAPLLHGLEGIEDADLVVMAVPVDAARAVLYDVARCASRAQLVTDVGSTKRAVVAAAEAAGLGPRFVGSHPLAGDHRSGWAASRLGLFEGARVFLTPAPSSGDAALALARSLWDSLRARVEVVADEVHDRTLAWISHLPQALATALACALAARGVPRRELGPGGRDASRLAGSSVEMWTGIALENADELGPALSAVEAEIAALRTTLERGDADALRRFFAGGKRWFDEEER